jgi:hypothetical protein
MTGDVEEAVLEKYLSGISVKKIAGVTDALSKVRIGKERYRQMLWIRPHDHAAAFSSLPSTSSPFSNLAPALTNATK